MHVAAADLDGDGDQDLATGHSFQDTTVYFQAPVLRFEPVRLSHGVAYHSFLLPTDLDADGDCDLVAANFNGSLALFWGGQ